MQNTSIKPECNGPKLCECGCGEPTSIAKYDDPKRGIKAGDYCRFVAGGHYWNLKRKSKPQGWKSSFERLKEREEVRKEVESKLATAPQNATREWIWNSFQGRGFRREGLTRIAYLRGLWNRLPKPVAPKAPEPYERREIDYERKTEIPLLANGYRGISLDESLNEDGSTRHDLVSNDNQLLPDADAVKREIVNGIENWTNGLSAELQNAVNALMDGEKVDDATLCLLRANADKVNLRDLLCA